MCYSENVYFWERCGHLENVKGAGHSWDIDCPPKGCQLKRYFIADSKTSDLCPRCTSLSYTLGPNREQNLPEFKALIIQQGRRIDADRPAPGPAMR